MNYNAIYTSLINNASHRQLPGECYYEKHHIIPRCMGGDDGIENIVKLTAREHYIAHQLLVKIYPNNFKLIHAAMMMTASNTSMAGRRSSKNRVYSWLRIKLSVKQRGKGNNNYGSVWVFSNEIQASKKIQGDQLSLFLDKGWKKGRVINFNKTETRSRICEHCQISFETKFQGKYCSQECKGIERNYGPHVKGIKRNYGPIWVFSKELQISKRIEKDQLSLFLDKGWTKGRVINFKKSQIISCKYCQIKFETICNTHRVHTNAKFCTPQCKIKYRESTNLIDNTIQDNLILIKQLYSEGISLNAICKKLGWVGAQGKYFIAIKAAVSG